MIDYVRQILDMKHNPVSPKICRNIDEGVVGSGLGLFLIGGH